MSALIADKRYDANYMVEAAHNVEVHAVIPIRARKKIAKDYDKPLYKEPNVIEHMFNKRKPCRRVAKSYDNLASAYLKCVFC